VPSIPRACHGGAETGAASRFLDHPAIGAQGVRSGPQHATLARIRVQAVAWLGQDTTLRDDGTPPPNSGLGPVKIKVREEYLHQPTVTCTPARMHRGVLVLKVWPRPAQPVAYERPRKPIAEKESDRWLQG
jgi:hypothetical protein